MPIAAIYLLKFRSAPLLRHVFMWLVAGAILAANWHWIEGYLLFSHYADLGEFYTPGGRKHFVPPGGWLAPFHVRVASPAIVSLAPPFFGMIGLYLWWRARPVPCWWWSRARFAGRGTPPPGAR